MSLGGLHTQPSARSAPGSALQDQLDVCSVDIDKGEKGRLGPAWIQPAGWIGPEPSEPNWLLA